jgi:hypothetical protein
VPTNAAGGGAGPELHASTRRANMVARQGLDLYSIPMIVLDVMDTLLMRECSAPGRRRPLIFVDQ